MSWLYIGLVMLWIGLLIRTLHKGIRKDESRCLMMYRALALNNIFWGIVLIIRGLIDAGFFWIG